MTVPLPAMLMDTAGATVSSQAVRHALGAAFRPATGAGQKYRSGVLAGPDQSQGEVALTSQTNLRVRPFLAVVQGSQTADQGPFVVPNLIDRNFTPPAKDATQTRRCLVSVRVDDTGVAGTATAYLELLVGALAPSAPALPSLPANAVALGEMTVAAGAGTSTAIWYSTLTVARGGILPVTSADTTPGVRVGEYRDHPTRGLQRWDGTVWRNVYTGTGYLGSGTGANSGTDQTGKTAALVNVTVPADLDSTRRVKITGKALFTSPTGVGVTLTAQGTAQTSRSINVGGLQTELSVVHYDTDLTPGTRACRLIVQSTVSGQTISYFTPTVDVEIV